MRIIKNYLPGNGSEGDWFEAYNCHQCANFIHVKEFAADDCNKGLLTEAFWNGNAPEWYQVWIDEEPTNEVGCKQFVNKDVRSDRAKQAHVTMKDNYYNDPRQMSLFDELD